MIIKGSKRGQHHHEEISSKDQPLFPSSQLEPNFQSRGPPPNPYGISTAPGPLYAHINTPQTQNGKVLTPPSYRPGMLQRPRGPPPRGPPPTIPMPERPPPSGAILNESTREKAVAPPEGQGSGNLGLQLGNEGVSLNIDCTVELYASVSFTLQSVLENEM